MGHFDKTVRIWTAGLFCTFLGGCSSETETLDQREHAVHQSETSELNSGEAAASEEQITFGAVSRTSGIAKIPTANGEQIVSSDSDVPRPRFFAKNAMASSWDGRLYFTPVTLAKDNVTGQWVRQHEVRYFRAENLKKVNGRVSTSDPDLLSAPRVVHHGYCTDSSEAACKVFGDRDLATTANNSQINNALHLAIYQTPGYPVNPYPSNASGVYQLEGDYLTYQITQVYAAKNVGTVSEEKLMAAVEATVIVNVANPQSAEIHQISSTQKGRLLSIGGDMARFPCENACIGDPVRGYEPTTSLDGRLIIYNSNSGNDAMTGYISYSFNEDPTNANGWSQPRSITELYYHLGPGRSGGEKLVGGAKFSTLYPLAKKPLLNTYGEAFGASTQLTGAYPWLSYDASELFFSTVSHFAMATRAGFSAIGARTNWAMQNMDGMLNLNRGKPFTSTQDIPFVWNDCSTTGANDRVILAKANGCEIQGDYQRMYSEKVRIVDEDGQLSLMPFSKAKNIFETVITIPIGLFPSQWQPFSGTGSESPALPVTPGNNVYAFTTSSTAKYAEYDMDHSLNGNYIVSWPMNELIEFDTEAMNERAANPNRSSIFDNLQREKKAVFSTEKTGDRSGNHYVGQLNGNAEFPFEHFNVKSAYQLCTDSSNCIGSDNGELLDLFQGIRGNALYLKPGSYVSANIKRGDLLPIKSRKKMAFSFWLNPESVENFAAANVNLIQLGNLILTKAGDDKLYLFGKIGGKWKAISPALSGALSLKKNNELDNWQHFALSFEGAWVETWINGVRQGAYKLSDNSFYNSFDQARELKVGHINKSPYSFSNYSFLIDEFDFMRTALDAKSLGRLSFSKEVSVPFYPGKRKELLQKLGKDLFFDTLLSADRSMSCASCHNPANAFADNNPQAVGAFGTVGNRNTPSALNRSFLTKQGMDGKFSELQDQVTHPIDRDFEMALPLEVAIERVKDQSHYLKNFREIYGENTSIKRFHLSQALAAYVDSLKTYGFAELIKDKSDNALKGKDLFFNKARCGMCHNGPRLTNEQMINLGDETAADWGRFLQTGMHGDKGSFKVPSLINLRVTGPYFHDGRFASLLDVVKFYNGGAINGVRTHPSIRPLGLSDEEELLVVDFLESLNHPRAMEANKVRPVAIVDVIRREGNRMRLEANRDISGVNLQFRNPVNGKGLPSIQASKLSFNSMYINFDLTGHEALSYYNSSTGVEMRLVKWTAKGKALVSNWVAARRTGTLNEISRPSIINAGAGCDDKECFWLRASDLADKFTLIISHGKNGETYTVLNEGSINRKNKDDGSSVLTYRIPAGAALNAFKNSAGLKLRLVNHNWGRTKSQQAADARTIFSK